MNTTLYKESQHFRQLWLWILLGGINLFFLYGVVQQVVFGLPFGNNPAPDGGLITMTLLLLALSFFFAIMRLDTEIREDGIYYRFYPLQRKFRSVEWAMIQRAFVRAYSPIREYGGWGIRLGVFGSGRAMNVRGNQGLQLVLKNNKKLLIGTQHPYEVQNTLNTLHPEYRES